MYVRTQMNINSVADVHGNASVSTTFHLQQESHCQKARCLFEKKRLHYFSRFWL